MSDEPRLEYRVRWRREGCREATRIYQSKSSALRKAEAILALEQIKDEIRQWETMPVLLESPTIQTRPVGEWEDAIPAPPPTGEAIERVREWADPGHDDHHHGQF